MTPEESRAQVVGAARQLVADLGMRVTRAHFAHSSCNDQGDAPFRGSVKIFYPLAPDFEESDAEVARWADRLRAAGWVGDTEFASHGTVLTKDGVVVVFAPQDASTPSRRIDVYGECRDVTTEKGATDTEQLTL